MNGKITDDLFVVALDISRNLRNIATEMEKFISLLMKQRKLDRKQENQEKLLGDN